MLQGIRRSQLIAGKTLGEVMRKLIIIAALVVPTVALLAVASPAQAATPKERNLARQVQTLKKQVKKLKTQNTTLKNRVTTLTSANATLTSANATLTTERNSLNLDKAVLGAQVTILTNERNDLKGQVNTAQQGAVAALGTMSESSLYSEVLPIITNVFNGGSSKYTASFYDSSDYSSRSFDYWGF